MTIVNDHPIRDHAVYYPSGTPEAPCLCPACYVRSATSGSLLCYECSAGEQYRRRPAPDMSVSPALYPTRA